MRPKTRYAKVDDEYVAYQVFGSGPPDVIFLTNWMTNLDVMWEEPSLARFLDRLASFSRVICFDKRGCGVSDPVALASLPTIEQWMDDARLVMDAAGSDRAALLGDTEGGPMAMVLAATHPERTSCLVLLNTFARWTRDDDYPCGMPAETVARLVRAYEENWGTTADILALSAPSVAADARFREWFTRYQRLAMPRGASTKMYGWVTRIDVRSVLSAIRVPTLVIHRSGSRHHRVEHGRYLAERITGARYLERPGADTFPYHAGDVAPVLDGVQEFLTGVRESPVHERVLATVMFTDIVSSTRHASALGDERWLDLRGAHDRLVRQYVLRFRGREIKHTGDGFLATFDGPARAVTCAAQIAAAVRPLGLEIRVGLHTGEVEHRSGDVGGIAVHIAARVKEVAGDGRVWVSRTVRELVEGSGIHFSAAGTHELKGVPGRWALYEVSDLR